MKDNFIPKYDIVRLNEILSDLIHLDLKITRYNKVYKVISDIFTDIICQIIFCPITPIFRARKNHTTSFTKINQLIFPKPYLQKKYGRLTKPHNPILYASSTVDIAVFEIQPEINDIVTIIQFELDSQYRNLQTYEIGVRDKFFHNVPHVLERHDDFKYSQDYKQIVERIESFFIEQFSVVIKDNEHYKYKITAAISEILFLNNDFAECLIYPSVASNLEGLNVGIKSEIFSTKYKPKSVAEFKILNRSFDNNSKEYNMLCLKKTDQIMDTGFIKW
jgi:hypothetical protein